MAPSKPVFSNFFDNVPLGSKEEAFDVLVKNEKCTVERIVSEGQTSADWYDQDETEFCCVLRGAADLLFEGSERPVRMNPGAWVLIPAHAKHKVTWTSDSEPTIWMAVKWKE